MMMKRKMPAVLLAGLMLLALAGCNANKATSDSGTAADSRITETVTDFTPETTVETALPADTESKTEATAEKEKAESTATLESGTAAETRKPTESSDKAETSPPTQAPKHTEPPKATEPQPTAPPESRPAETTAPTTPPTETKPETEPPAETQPPKGFTETDHNRIVSEVKAYAESYKAKGFNFEWSDSLEFGWDVGWMGTPRISRDGVDGTIKTLKHHVDLIYKSGTDPANGVTADSVLYRVVQLEIDGGIAYAVIYG